MVTKDDYKYAYIRKLMLEAVREDLIGPGSDDELITDYPTSKYITGIVYPSDSVAEELDEDFDDCCCDDCCDCEDDLEDIADDVKDAVEDVVDDVKDAVEDITD